MDRNFNKFFYSLNLVNLGGDGKEKLTRMYLVKRPPFPGRRYFRFGW